MGNKLVREVLRSRVSDLRMELKPEKACFPCEEEDWEEFRFLVCPNGRKERRERKAEVFCVVVAAGEAATEEEYEGISRRASRREPARCRNENLCA